jgi:hypothetical protein
MFERADLPLAGLFFCHDKAIFNNVWYKKVKGSFMGDFGS